MSFSSPLHLHEQLMLLALHDEKGTVHYDANLKLALGGAVLAELTMAGRLRVEGKKGKARVHVSSREPLGEPLLDECLERVAGDDKPRKPVHWVQKFGGVKDIKHRVAARLVEEGVLKEEEGQVLFFFSRTLYPEQDNRPEREIKQDLYRAVVSGGTVEPKTAVLMALAKATGLLKRAVDKDVRKRHKDRIKKIVAGEMAGDATKEAVEAMQAAVMVAVILPAVTAGTASH